MLFCHVENAESLSITEKLCVCVDPTDSQTDAEGSSVSPVVGTERESGWWWETGDIEKS